MICEKLECLYPFLVDLLPPSPYSPPLTLFRVYSLSGMEHHHTAFSEITWALVLVTLSRYTGEITNRGEKEAWV